MSPHELKWNTSNAEQHNTNVCSGNPVCQVQNYHNHCKMSGSPGTDERYMARYLSAKMLQDYQWHQSQEVEYQVTITCLYTQTTKTRWTSWQTRVKTKKKTLANSIQQM